MGQFSVEIYAHPGSLLSANLQIRDYPFRFDVAEANLDAVTSGDRIR